MSKYEWAVGDLWRLRASPDIYYLICNVSAHGYVGVMRYDTLTWQNPHRTYSYTFRVREELAEIIGDLISTVTGRE